MRSFYILNKRVSSPGSRSPNPNQSQDSIAPVLHSALEYRRGFRDRIRYRDIVWAFHSNSQEILLAASTAACGGKMLWKDARAMGVFLWLNSVESLVRIVRDKRWSFG
jgi:RAVE protein 1 C terminal